jgi:hypothetical protein
LADLTSTLFENVDEFSMTMANNFSNILLASQGISDSINAIFTSEEATSFFNKFEELFGTNPFESLEVAINDLVNTVPSLVSAIGSIPTTINVIGGGSTPAPTDGSTIIYGPGPDGQLIPIDGGDTTPSNITPITLVPGAGDFIPPEFDNLASQCVHYGRYH